MQGYQKYRKYQKSAENKGLKFAKMLIFLAIVFVVFLIGKGIFGGDTNVESSLPENKNMADADSAENANGNTNEADNDETNSNANGNTNLNVNIDTTSANSFDMESCVNVYSRGSSVDKKVSLTFNVGTTKEGSIDQVLSALSSAGVPADFFARGDVAEEAPDLIRKISGAGFSVYNLSYSHPYFSDLPESGMIEQLEEAEAAIGGVTGKTTMPFFRPPYGDADSDVLAVVSGQGYCPVTWTVDALDWSSDYTAAQSKERVLSGISNGAIVLMQAANSITAEIVPGIITELQGQGYDLVDLSTLLAS